MDEACAEIIAIIMRVPPNQRLDVLALAIRALIASGLLDDYD